MATKLDLSKFNDKQRMALEMLCQPKRGGMEYGEIAKAVGVDIKTLYRWRQTPEFVQSITSMAILRLHEDLPDVIDAMLRRAKNGEVRSVDLMFKLLGLLIHKAEVDVDVEIDNSANENIADDIQRLKDMLKKR